MKRILALLAVLLPLLSGCAALVRDELLSLQDQIDSLTLAGRDSDKLIEGLDSQLDSLQRIVDKYQNSPEIVFEYSENDLLVIPGETVSFTYSIVNADANTTVSAVSDGVYAARVFPISSANGYIEVKCPAKCDDGYVTILLSDDCGYVSMKVIDFTARKITFTESIDYVASNLGGTVSFPFVAANFDYELTVRYPEGSESGWVGIASTRAQSYDGAISLTIAKNVNKAERRAFVDIVCKDNGKVFGTITITQEPAVFEVIIGEGFPNPNVSPLGISGKEAEIRSSLKVSPELTLTPSSASSWLNATVVEREGKSYLSISTSSNDSDSERSAVIRVYSSDNIGVYADVPVNQFSAGKPLMFEVGGLTSAGQTVYLPIAGSVDLDCLVDWGDGRRDSYSGASSGSGTFGEAMVSHVYSAAGKYTVRVYGAVPSLSANNIPEESKSFVTAVLDWGGYEFSDFSHAFERFSALKSVPAHDAQLFRKVKDFSYSFSGCSALESIPSAFFANCSEAGVFTCTFSDCLSLKAIPSDIFTGCIRASGFRSAFSGCSSISSVPSGLFADCPEAVDFAYCFFNCTSLSSVPTSIFDRQKNAVDFSFCFTLAPIKGESPYSNVGGRKVHLYERSAADGFASPAGECCFSSASISDYADIPDTWKYL